MTLWLRKYISLGTLLLSVSIPSCARAQVIELHVKDSTITKIGPEFFGIQYHANTYGDPVALKKLSKLPLAAVRVWAYPSTFHPAPGQWQWEALDAQIDEVARAGYKPFVCLFQAENWYKGTPDDPWWNDEDARSEWIEAARMLTHRYQDQVDWWILFDEVNYLHPTRPYYMSLETSAELFLEAAKAIKTVDSDAFVGGPSGFAGWENGHWANHVLALEDGNIYLDFISSNLFLSWNKGDSDEHIMDRTIWYEEAPSKIKEMIGARDDPMLVLDAYNASALWTEDGTPEGDLWTDPRNVNTFGGVYQTAALLHSAQGGFDITLRWETLGGFGVLSWYPHFAERPPYYAWLLVSDQGRLRPGSSLLPISTTEQHKDPLPHHSDRRVKGYTVQPFAVKGEGGISVILVNKYGEDKDILLSTPQGMQTYSIYRFDKDRHEESLQQIAFGNERTVDLTLPGVSVTIIQFEDAEATGIVREAPGASKVSLFRNTPNPFKATTTISLEVPSAGELKLDIFSSAGQHISTLFAGPIAAGRHTFVFEAGGLSSGVYFYTACAEGSCLSKPMILVK